MGREVQPARMSRGTTERVFLPAFHDRLARRDERSEIFDPDLRKLLDGSVRDPTLYSQALDRIAGQITAAREAILYPDQLQPSHHTLLDCYQIAQAGGIIQGWQRLASDAGYLALDLANPREPVEGEQPADRVTNKVKRRLRASQIVLALRLMVLALLYQQRATIDEDVTARRVMQNAFQRPDAVVAVFVRWITRYDAQVRAWSLRRDLPPGWKEAGDATSYSSWSRDFGRPRDAEIGWSPYARAVGSALRFQSHRMELRQLWSETWRGKRGLLTPIALLGAVALWAFGLTTGFGLKPSRFAGTTFLTIVVFSVAYFADAAVSGCAGQAWSVGDFPRNIYYAVANLTGVGALPSGCVRDAGAIISAESLMGYFLLSVLAAMLFAWLTDR